MSESEYPNQTPPTPEEDPGAPGPWKGIPGAISFERRKLRDVLQQAKEQMDAAVARGETVPDWALSLMELHVRLMRHNMALWEPVAG